MNNTQVLDQLFAVETSELNVVGKISDLAGATDKLGFNTNATAVNWTRNGVTQRIWTGNALRAQVAKGGIVDDSAILDMVLYTRTDAKTGELKHVISIPQTEDSATALTAAQLKEARAKGAVGYSNVAAKRIVASVADILKAAANAPKQPA